MDLDVVKQEELNTHLASLGLSPEAAVWGSMLDLTYLMPTFLDKGGRYNTAFSYPFEEGPHNSYPSPRMKVIFGDGPDANFVYINRSIQDGYPVIVIKVPEGSYWPIVVHPDHLDAALLHILQVPND